MGRARIPVSTRHRLQGSLEQWRPRQSVVEARTQSGEHFAETVKWGERVSQCRPGIAFEDLSNNGAPDLIRRWGGARQSLLLNLKERGNDLTHEVNDVLALTAFLLEIVGDRGPDLHQPQPCRSGLEQVDVRHYPRRVRLLSGLDGVDEAFHLWGHRAALAEQSSHSHRFQRRVFLLVDIGEELGQRAAEGVGHQIGAESCFQRPAQQEPVSHKSTQEGSFDNRSFFHGVTPHIRLAHTLMPVRGRGVDAAHKSREPPRSLRSLGAERGRPVPFGTMV